MMTNINIEVDMNDVESVENYLKLLRLSKQIGSKEEDIEKQVDYNSKKESAKKLYRYIAKQQGKKVLRADVYKNRKQIGFNFNGQATMSKVIDVALKMFPDLKKRYVFKNGTRHAILALN